VARRGEPKRWADVSRWWSGARWLTGFNLVLAWLAGSNLFAVLLGIVPGQRPATTRRAAIRAIESVRRIASMRSRRVGRNLVTPVFYVVIGAAVRLGVIRRRERVAARAAMVG
jgi:hypothetical protein